jgi:glucose-1-phosphate adenylyltransferase
MSLDHDLANSVTVLILGGGRGIRLHPLTQLRSKPAVPVGAKYRLIDISISNAINSGMERMYVLTQFNSVSLHRHIGRTYRFDAFSRGYVQILAAQQTPHGQAWFQGTADSVRQNLNVFRELQGEYVLVLAGDHIYRMDYRQLLRDHVENEADITVGVKPCSEADIASFGRRGSTRAAGSSSSERSRLRGGARGHGGAPAARRQGFAPIPLLASMGIYMFNKEALLDVLDSSLVDFGRDIIPAEAGRRRVQAHFFKGYWRDIGTIRAFFDAHMDLVSRAAFLPRSAWPIYTCPAAAWGASGCRLITSCLARAPASSTARSTTR